MIKPGLLNFVDAYNETVGMSVSDRPDTIGADCGNLTSMGIAISKMQKRISKKGVLLVFDSLTSPYLLSGPAVVRFMRLNLSKFVAEGNSVLACFDEGSGKEEDLVGMMSLSNGVIKMELKEGKQVLNVVKHPKVEQKKIEVSVSKLREEKLWDPESMEKEMNKRWWEWTGKGTEPRIRSEVGDYVNIFWPNLVLWSSILWDPKRFPMMRYELIKKMGTQIREFITMAPWRMRLLFKFAPKDLSKPKNAKRILKFFGERSEQQRGSIIEYLEDVSKTDEHYIRVYESSECWGFENIGTAMDPLSPPLVAGICMGIEKKDRDWNSVETKCIGLGDPHCEYKVVPREIDELRDSLEKDSLVIQRIQNNLMDRLVGFLLEGKPLVERPKLGNSVYFEAFSQATALPAVAGERYRMATRMGGTKSGKRIGEYLMDAELGKDEAMKRILNFLEYCKVGKITANETIRIKENCEGIQIRTYTTKAKEPSCFFTTGFLNGFFYAVENQHVEETKCIAIGDPYCEWAFR